jgi:hypothetical protein
MERNRGKASSEFRRGVGVEYVTDRRDLVAGTRISEWLERVYAWE